MVSTYSLKKKFQDFLRPLACFLLSSKMTPNQVTIFTVVLSVVFSLVLSAFGRTAGLFWSVPVFLFIRMALNAIDGMMAREGSMTSSLGVFLNELGDVISDLALFFAFCSSGLVRIEPMILFSILALLSEMAGVVAVQVGSVRRYEGPMGKSDRAFLVAILAVLLACGVQATVVFDALLDLGSLALFITVVMRVRSALLESKTIERKVRDT